METAQTKRHVPRQTRRAIIGGGSAAVAGWLAAACGQTSSTSPPGPQGTAGPASLDVWVQEIGTAQKVWGQTANEFKAKYPAINVSIEILPGGSGEQEQKILASVAGGTIPDLVWIHPVYNANFAIKGVTAPLDPFLAKNKAAVDLKDFYAGVIDYFRWDGKLWSLPYKSGPGVFYYNTALLKQRGADDPWELFQKGQWTIEKFDDAVRRLTFDQGGVKTYGQIEVGRTIQFISPWIEGFGGELWNAQVTESRMQEDNAVRAWEYLTSRLTSGYAPDPDTLKGVAGGDVGLFTAGRVSFYFGIRSTVPSFRDTPIGMVPMHKMPKGKDYNRDGPNGLAVTQGSRQQDAAWQFILFEIGRGIEVGMAEGFTSPTSRTHAKNPLWVNQMIPGENARAYDIAAGQVKALPLPPGSVQINTLVGQAFDRTLKGQASAKVAMLEIRPQVDAILAGRGK
jgi:ABC-type glycerol-3-phosphate transport system substrate-binding protein